MCADAHLDENPFSFKVADLEWSYVRFPKNQSMRGWTIVVLKRHASELFELDDRELCGFWKEVAHVAAALNRIHRPAKLDYGVFGHHIPHVPHRRGRYAARARSAARISQRLRAEWG
jgi:diadenosine tetraphosphate (Ap4A) HIT family hydrolase